MTIRTVAAVDIGASAGRVIAGTVDGDRISLETVHRFPNGIVERDGHLRWELSRLHREVVDGLNRVPGAESIGVDTWGVDYGLLDEDGRLLAEPVSYRYDDRTSKLIGDVHAAVSPERLYEITGLQFLPFNTIYQLAADRRGPAWPRARKAVLIPDLITYWLTGDLHTEVTVASTTGLLDVNRGDWSIELLDAIGIPRELFPAIVTPGTPRGRTRAATPVITVGAHDTASAIVAVPSTTDRFAYISSGTWSLVGVELERPVVSEEARQAGFTNEAGVDGRTRFLRNVGGLWLLQECLREWPGRDLARLLAEAAGLSVGGPRVDAADPGFFSPGGMAARIATAAGAPRMSEAAVVRCVLDSLAAGYARAVEDASALSRKEVDVVHVLGGGAQNELLCQLTADASGRPVLAGPAEATALGNVLIQARAASDVPASLEALRAVVAGCTLVRRYEPS